MMEMYGRRQKEKTCSRRTEKQKYDFYDDEILPLRIERIEWMNDEMNENREKEKQRLGLGLRLAAVVIFATDVAATFAAVVGGETDET